MRTLIATINTKYIHLNNSVYLIQNYLKAESTIKTFTHKDSVNYILESITREDYDFYFFSVYIYNIEIFIEIFKNLKKIRPKSVIVVGGPEVSYEFDYLFDYVDIVYRGQVDESINEIIERNISKEHIVLKNQSKSYCFYSKTLPDIIVYKSIPFTPHKIAYIETSRGCPYKCSYCMSSLENNMVYYEIRDVYKIIDLIIAKKIKIIKFLDRTFNINEKRAIKILDYITKKSLSYQSFQFEIAPEIITANFLEYLKKVPHNKFRFEIGIQSVFNKTINAVDRFQTYKNYQDTIKTLIDKTKVITHLDLIAGLPYETFNQFKTSFNKTFMLQPDEYQLGILKLLKGTKIRKQQELHQIKFTTNAPYTIIENKYISKKQIKYILDVENIVDRYYNNNKLTNTFKKIVECHTDTFDFLLDFSNYLNKNNYILFDYQIYDIFMWLYSYLEIINPSIKDFVIYDYIKISKTKPKKFYNTITKKERNSVLKSLVNSKKSLNYLSKYCIVEKLSLDKEIYIIKDIKTGTINQKDIK